MEADVYPRRWISKCVFSETMAREGRGNVEQKKNGSRASHHVNNSATTLQRGVRLPGAS
jgi:hypothetical protein